MRFRNRLVDSRGSSPRPLLGADVDEEPGEHDGTGDEQAQHQPEVVVRGEDAHDDEDEADGRQHGADGVEGPGRVGWDRDP